jgi:hypothetical protein
MNINEKFITPTLEDLWLVAMLVVSFRGFHVVIEALVDPIVFVDNRKLPMSLIDNKI